MKKAKIIWFDRLKGFGEAELLNKTKTFLHHRAFSKPEQTFKLKSGVKILVDLHKDGHVYKAKIS